MSFYKQTIGVDIGHSSVKVVGFSLENTPRLIGCKEVVMDPKYLHKEGFNDPAAIGKAIREAMLTAAPHTISSKVLAYAAISESLVFRKIIDMPLSVTSENMREALLLEAGQYFPESIETMEVDFQIFQATPGSSTQQVIIMAVSKQIIQEYLAVFAAAKIEIKAIDTKPAAIARAIIGETDKNDTFIIVDIGSEISTVSLYDQGFIKVTGIVNMGGNVIRETESLQLIEEDKQALRLKKLAVAISEEVSHVLKFYVNRSTKQNTVKAE